MLLAPPNITRATLFSLALLALPAIGHAAEAQAAAPSVGISASAKSSGGAVAIKVKNRSSRSASGKLAAKVGRTAAGTAGFKVNGRKSTTVRLGLSRAARGKLAADGRLRLSVRASVKGGVSSAATVVVTGAGRPPAGVQGGSGFSPSSTGAGSGRPAAGTGTTSGGGKPAGGSTQQPGGNQGGGQPDPQPENPNWVAGDLRFSLAGGQITVTQRPLAYLQCSENGGSYRTYGSWEVFQPTGPWTLGAQEQEMSANTALVNSLAGSSPHTVKYKLRTARVGDRITGQLYMSSAWSNYDYYNNKIVFVNCFGTTSFEATQG